METTFRRDSVFVYLRMKFNLYAEISEPEFQAEFVIVDADYLSQFFDKTKETFAEYWQKWYNILNAPSAQTFTARLQKLHSDRKIKDMAKHVAMMQCYLNNSMYDPIKVPECVVENPEMLIETLRELDVQGPDLLEVTKVFEELTTDR